MVCASAPCTRNSRLAAADLGASCACTMTGTPASRAAMTGDTEDRAVDDHHVDPMPPDEPGEPRRVRNGTPDLERRPCDAPQIGRDVGPRTIAAATGANAPRSGPVLTAITRSNS